MHVHETGNPSGPILLFLHGGGVSSWMWEGQLPHFQANCHCLTPDLPGHGKSRNQAFSIGSSADELLAYLEKRANGKDITVIGFSLGSQVALEMVARGKGVISRVMLNSVAVHPIPLIQPLVKPLIYTSFPLIKSRTFSKLQSKTLHIDTKHFETYFKETKQMSARTLIEVMRENSLYQLPDDTVELSHCSGLVTMGANENRLIKKSAQTLAKAFPHFKQLIFADVGHGLPLAKPMLFNKALEQWLSKTENKTRAK